MAKVSVALLSLLLLCGATAGTNTININFAGMLSGLTACDGGDEPVVDDSFLTAIRQLSPSDGLLSTRTSTKSQLCSNLTCDAPAYGGDGRTAAEWAGLVRAAGVHGAYDEWSCGYTLGTLTEVWDGLSMSFNEYRDGRGQVGYQQIDTLSQLLAHFESHRSSSVAILHRLRIIGTSDHVWAIEQLADGAGYRIYQSYHEAYSLHAWLAPDLATLESLVGTDIINWSLYDLATAALAQFGLTWATIGFMPEGPIKDWFLFIQSYDEWTAFEIVKASWEKFGGGRVVDGDTFFDEYLTAVGTAVEEMRATEAADGVYTQSENDNWNLFSGGQNPQQYPGVDFDYIPNQSLGPTALIVKSRARDTTQSFQDNVNVIKADAGL